MRSNAIAERWISGARGECLDQMLITGEPHLRLVLSEYVDRYDIHHPHRTLGRRPPAGRENPRKAPRSVGRSSTQSTGPSWRT